MVTPRLHLLGMPHTETTDAYSWCAFTSLIASFSTMMTRHGSEVILYAGPDNEAECAEHVVCSAKPANTDPFVPPWTAAYFEPMNLRVIAEMSKRIEPGDIVLRQQGPCTGTVQRAFPNNVSCEPICGYAGATAPAKVYPSETWRHLVSGWQCGLRQENVHTIWGQSSDVTIPHFLDVSKFPAGSGGDYLAFVGRLGGMKGDNIAVHIAQQMGVDLIIAGPGGPNREERRAAKGRGIDYVGVVKPKERAEVMGGALAVMTPSQFPEPFCLVAVESQMVGTPVIATDWGAFVETVQHGVTGVRCNTMDEFADAVTGVKALDRERIRERAIDLYSFDAIASQYERYFARLVGMHDAGWL
jgi:glycosyltransferase involved in cell wall biosynthesis